MFCIKGKAMSNNAMSNETNLDWLARSIHVWPECIIDGTYKECLHWIEPVKGEVKAAFASNTLHCFTRDEWLARRAELQNKPSWDYFGESAKFMAQDSDGAWMAFESEPAAKYHVWSSMRGWCGYAREGRDRCRGEVLGDWRDTLERRPESTRAEMEVELVKAAFKPFTSIEDDQEKNVTQQQEIKQDNGWHERGELPPVGVDCQAYVDERWVDAYVVGFIKNGAVTVDVRAYQGGVKSGLRLVTRNAAHFRPIRTERDQLVDVLSKAGIGSYALIAADAILAAGFSRRDK